MPRDSQPQWIEFTDFSPGIFSNNNLAGGVNVTSLNPCYAQEEGTYRCISLPTGGLGPLPRRVESTGLTTPPGPASTDYTVQGLGTWGRVRPVTPTDVDNDSRFEIHLSLYYEVPNSPNVDIYEQWVRERSFDVAKGTDLVLDSNEIDVDSNVPRFAHFLKTRMNPATPDEPGTPVMVCVTGLVGNDELPVSNAFPDPAAPATLATLAVGDLTTPPVMYTNAAAHQGRVVFATRLDWEHGPSTLLDTDENLLWTDTNTATLVSSIPAVFVPEVDGRVSDLCSMSANQLVVIKIIGGGYVLQGDLSDVTVLRLPNLMCPDGGPTIKGVNTSRGFVYSAGYNGLYLWNGGDQAAQISQQLDGEAFVAGQGITIRGHGGQCDRWMNLVLAPRNWVWQGEETRPGWWRLEDPGDLMIRLWSTTADASRVVGVESEFTDDDLFIHQYDYNDLAYSYSWKSHPLWISQDRFMEVRQGIIALQGHGSVTITCWDELGNSSAQTIFVDSDIIRNYRWNIASDAESLVVQIEAEGHTSGGAATYEAPLVHRMFLSYNADSHLPLTT